MPFSQEVCSQRGLFTSLMMQTKRKVAEGSRIISAKPSLEKSIGNEPSDTTDVSIQQFNQKCNTRASGIHCSGQCHAQNVLKNRQAAKRVNN